jgi:hypothetical protein
MAEYCCDRMAFDLGQKCAQHPDRFDCPDALVAKVDAGFGLIVHDGARSVIRIGFCPWCGTPLAGSEDTSPPHP